MTACVVCDDELKRLLAACGPVRPPSAGATGAAAVQGPPVGRGAGNGAGRTTGRVGSMLQSVL